MKMQWVKTSKPIDLSDWNFDFGDLDEIIGKGVSEGLANVLSDERTAPDLDLPVYWSRLATDTDGHFGPQPADPATLYLCLPFSDDGDNECCWSLSLFDLVKDTFHNPHAEGEQLFEPDQRTLALAKRLREIAEWLETPHEAIAGS
jgi:hypothetical protein